MIFHSEFPLRLVHSSWWLPSKLPQHKLWARKNGQICQMAQGSPLALLRSWRLEDSQAVNVSKFDPFLNIWRQQTSILCWFLSTFSVAWWMQMRNFLAKVGGSHEICQVNLLIGKHWMWKRTINQGSLVTWQGPCTAPKPTQALEKMSWSFPMMGFSELFSESADWTVKETTIYKHPKIQLLILQMFDPTWLPKIYGLPRVDCLNWPFDVFKRLQRKVVSWWVCSLEQQYLHHTSLQNLSYLHQIGIIWKMLYIDFPLSGIGDSDI